MKIIIVEHLSNYSGASSQRMLGYGKAFVEMGHEVVMITSPEVPLPHSVKAKFRCVEINEKRKGILDIIKTYKQFVHAIKCEYDDNSVIFFYESQPYSFLFRSPKYMVFSEQTEIPYCGLRPSAFHRIIEWIKKYSMMRFSGVVTISKGLKDYYERQGLLNVEVINMFVDYSRFDNITISHEEKYIAYCGTVSVHKDGVDTLIKAFSFFREKHPEYKLYLIGQMDLLGAEEIIKNLIKSLDLKESVIYKGRINADELPSILSGARMLALARPNTVQAQYGFPTKLGEYLATGKPVVVTKVGEIPLYLRDGENAFLAEPEDPESFAAKLLEVESDYIHALKIGEKGRELVFTEFSSVVQSKKLMRFITERINSIKNNPR